MFVNSKTSTQMYGILCNFTAMLSKSSVLSVACTKLQ